MVCVAECFCVLRYVIICVVCACVLLGLCGSVIFMCAPTPVLLEESVWLVRLSESVWFCLFDSM